MTVTECDILRNECADCIDRNFCKVRYKRPPHPEMPGLRREIKSLRALLERCLPIVKDAPLTSPHFDTVKDRYKLASDITKALGREKE